MDEFQYLHKNFDQILKPSIFIVEDDAGFSKVATIFLEKCFNCEVKHFVNPDQFLEFITERADFTDGRFFVLVTDISFEETNRDGLLLIDWLKEKQFNFSSIVMTGFASIESAINATKKGVFQYLTKPFDIEILNSLVREIFQKHCPDLSKDLVKPELVSSNNKVYSDTYKIELPQEEDIYCGMIGRSKKMQDVFARVKKVSESNSTVLINGPSGTGKELIAQAIHSLSSRSRSSLVSVNCGAIPSELLESELFGHEKGAFTGAIAGRRGRFELANNGSLFLDEIGDMPLLLQVKLLRVLQNKMIERVGGSDAIPVDVRIITATHRDLEAAVVNGNFREDLFYRLNVIPIRVPSLKERREDIPLLISHFLKKYSSADGRNTVRFDDDVFEVMMRYSWPGNVRELENLIERLVILKGGSTIRLQDLPEKFLGGLQLETDFEGLVELPEEGIDLKRMVSSIEDSLILQALKKTKGNKNQASKLLQINRTTLIEKIKKKNLENRI